MRLLFLGNSHTYKNGLPFLVREMINASDPDADCETHMVTPGGKPLVWHANEKGSRLSIQCCRWDVIVIQQQTHPFPGYHALKEACDKLGPLLQASRARVLLYMTWAAQGRPEDQPEMDDAFRRVAAENDIETAPVSTAWQHVLRTAPHIGLYETDGSHAAPPGSYLAACVFYARITGQSPVGLPARIAPRGVTLADLPEEDARTLQNAALEAG